MRGTRHPSPGSPADPGGSTPAEAAAEVPRPGARPGAGRRVDPAHPALAGMGTPGQAPRWRCTGCGTQFTDPRAAAEHTLLP